MLLFFHDVNGVHACVRVCVCLSSSRPTSSSHRGWLFGVRTVPVFACVYVCMCACVHARTHTAMNTHKHVCVHT